MISTPPEKNAEKLTKWTIMILKSKPSMTKKLPSLKKKFSLLDWKPILLTVEKKSPDYSKVSMTKPNRTLLFPRTLNLLSCTLPLMLVLDLILDPLNKPYLLIKEIKPETMSSMPKNTSKEFLPTSILPSSLYLNNWLSSEKLKTLLIMMTSLVLPLKWHWFTNLLNKNKWSITLIEMSMLPSPISLTTSVNPISTKPVMSLLRLLKKPNKPSENPSLSNLSKENKKPETNKPKLMLEPLPSTPSLPEVLLPPKALLIPLLPTLKPLPRVIPSWELPKLSLKMKTSMPDSSLTWELIFLKKNLD